MCRDQLSRMLDSEIVGPFGALDDEHVAAVDLPAEPGLLERLVDRLRILVEHGAEAVPWRLAPAADREHRVGVGDAMRHVCLPPVGVIAVGRSPAGGGSAGASVLMSDPASGPTLLVGSVSLPDWWLFWPRADQATRA